MKKLVGILIMLVVMLLGISIGTYMLIDQKAVRDHVTQAFHEQTGLDLKMETASFQVFPWPSFHAGQVVLTRSGCTPFVQARSVHADISLLALLHREVSFQDFTVENAQITLHRTHDGVCSSWLPFTADDKPAAREMGDAPSAATSHAHWKVSFDALHVTSAQLSWRDDHSSKGEERSGGFTIASLDLQGMHSVSPWIDLHAYHGETPFNFKGRMGSFHRVLSASTPQGEPWGFSLGLTFGKEGQQDQMVMDGSFTDPHRLKGLRLSMQGHWADLRDIEQLFPHIGVPAVQSVGGMVDVRERDEPELPAGGFLERLAALPGKLYPVQMHVQLGSVDFPQGTLGIEAPLHLRQLQMDADASLAPLTIHGDADWGRFSWGVHAQLGTLEKSVAAWKQPDQPTVPLEATLQGRDRNLMMLLNHREHKTAAEQDGVQFHAQGTLGRQASQLSFDGQADMLQAPELPGIEQGLSGTIVHGLSLSGQLSAGAFLPQGLKQLDVHDLRFDSREVGGDGRFSITRPVVSQPASIEAHLHLTHADGDALLPASVQGDGEEASPSAQGSQDHSDRLQAVRTFLDTHHILLDLTADQLAFYGMDYRDAHITLALGDRRLLVDPLKASVGGVALSAKVEIDNITHPTTVRVQASPWMMPSTQFFQLIGQSPVFEGPVQLDGALETQGDTQEALLSSLEGAMGLSVVKGQIHTSVLAPLAGPAAAFLKLGNGTMGLRCAAVRVNLHHGQGVLEALGAQTKHFLVKGHGQVKLDDGALSLQLLPHVSLAGNEMSMPIRVAGTITAPQITSLRTEGGQNQLDIGQGTETADLCQEVISKARDGHDGLPIPALSGEHSRTSDILKALGIGGKP